MTVTQYFGMRANFAQLIKIVGKPRGEGDDRRYSPGEITSIIKRVRTGRPDPEKISTSIVERSNLTIRMRMRRFTRLTNGFSKSWLHHEAAFALFAVAYNLVLIHGTLKTTPAVKHGLTDHPWTVEELLTVLATHC
jgi:hypothetical protein